MHSQLQCHPLTSVLRKAAAVKAAAVEADWQYAACFDRAERDDCYVTADYVSGRAVLASAEPEAEVGRPGAFASRVRYGEREQPWLGELKCLAYDYEYDL